MKLRLLTRLSVLLLALASSGPLAAQWQRDDDSDRDNRWDRQGLSNAISGVESRTGGRVLSAEPRRQGDREQYRVKVITPDGRVKYIYTDR